MARIPDDEIGRLKREVSLVGLAAAHGLELKGTGDNLLGRCPWHEDGTASLVVTVSKNLWHCMAGCGGGSVIDWVMRTQGVSFRHAVEVLRGDVAAVVPSGRRAMLPCPVEASAEDREVLSQVVSYYHETLKQSPEALAYLEERGLRSAEAIDHFQLGFANRTLGYRLPGRAARERLEKLGILRESGHEHFNGSLVIPILGEGGEVLGMYGRKITARLRKGTPLHLYLPGPRRGVFNLPALRGSKTVILCEALIDALTFWCAGHRNVTASYGVEGFTADHLAAFKSSGTETVLIAYDRDEAGERAAESLAGKLMAEGIECFRVGFPRGMDANEYALKVQPPEKSLGVLIRNATWLGRGPRDAVSGAKRLYSWRRRSAAAAPLEDREAPDGASEAGSPDAPPAAPSVSQGETSAALSADPSLACAPALSLAALAAKEETSGPPLIEPGPVSGESATAPGPAGVAAAGDEVVIAFEDRRYRVRGLSKNLSYDLLKVNLLAGRGEALHVDTLDLYSARQRASFVKQAGLELKVGEELVKRDLGQVLLKLEELQAEQIRRTLEVKPQEKPLSEEERQAALALLRDPRLLTRILSDFEACGVVGERTNELLGYLAAVSRKLEEPLAVIVQSASAAGKSSLMEAILAFMPEEQRVKYSAMTGQSLFYMGETDLQHKILAIVEEQGAERATYALKLLQSEGELTIASTGKDPHTGRLVTQEYRVAGPVMIFLTTTALEVDEELLNRCLVLTVDEDREQTRAIHRLQRERQTLEGLLARQARLSVLKVHQDAQRLLKPLLVANPYARHLTFLDDRTRTRRDHVKYLTLIRTIALLHQYQRPLRTVEHRGVAVPYVEVTLEDIAVANQLAHQVLGRSLDELAPQTRRLLMILDRMVSEACARERLSREQFLFSRRLLREHTGWSNTQVHVHLSRLVELEYVIPHRSPRGQGFSYELVYDGAGQDGTPFLSGLIDVEALAAAATTTSIPALEPGIRGGFAPDSAPFPGAFGPRSAAAGLTDSDFEDDARENAGLGDTSEERRNGNGPLSAHVRP
jgi:DNA primase catalytic core